MRNGYPIERSQAQRCRHAENNERGGTIEAVLLVGALMMGLLVGVIFVMRNFSSPSVLVSWWVVGAFGAAAGGAFRALADARRAREDESRQQ